MTINKVIVIGAGMSGLAAARELQHRRYNVIVIEARSRIGGRVWGSPLQTSVTTEKTKKNEKKRNDFHPHSLHAFHPNDHEDDDKKTTTTQSLSAATASEVATTETETVTYVDLGGALIHGTAGNPLSQLCVQLGVATSDNLSESLLLDNNGWPVDPKQDEKVSQCFNEALDKTFQQIMARQQKNVSEDLGQAQATTINHKAKRRRTLEHDDDNHHHEQDNQLSDDAAEGNFGHLFHTIAVDEYGASIVESPLWTWHQANLELSCGASFDQLGYTWNDDEAYGYEGAHVSLRNSWKTVVEALAEPLSIAYDCQVTAIEIIEESRPTVVAPDANATNNRKHKETLRPASPSRKSRRLQGEDANIRRSRRSTKQTQAFTVHSYSSLSYDDTSLQHPERRKPKLPPKVRVTLHNGAVLEADAVVCTIPLGVLKTNTIQFIPPLPDVKKKAIADMGCGLLNKCILSFPQVFWQDTDFLGLAGEDTPFLILNGHKITGKPILIFMFGGESAFDVDADWCDTDLVEECMNVLRKISKTPPPQPLDYIVTRWGQDAFARMCFSYVPPNVDGGEALSALGQPLVSSDGRPMVLFAGEHTTPFHPSTIHGAFLSGIREAYRLDLTLEPQLNNGLTFDPSNLYQKTFGLKRLKNAAVPSQSVLEWANGSRFRTGEEDSHRRRHGAMTLRKKKGPSLPAALMSPTRQSVRTSLNDSELEPSRKSLRKSKSPMRWVAAGSDDDDDDDDDVGNGDSSKLHSHERNGHHHHDKKSTAAAESAVAQEERSLQRLVHQYPNWQVIASKVLPLHNSTRKSSVLKRRYQQLRQTLLKRGGDKSVLKDWKVGQIKDMKPLSIAVADHVTGNRKSSRTVAQGIHKDSIWILLRCKNVCC